MLIDTLVTSELAFGRVPGPGAVRQVLGDCSLDGVLRFLTGPLHRLESAPLRIEEAFAILPLLAQADTVSAIRKAVAKMQTGGTRRPAIFTPLTLLNFLKEAVLRCRALTGPINSAERERLLRAYWATHDHFQKAQSPLDRLKEDLLSQLLAGGAGRFTLTIPRYWALWITIPKRRGTAARLADFLPPGFPKPHSKFILPLLGLWVSYFARKEQSNPIVLEESGWASVILPQVKLVIEQSSLGASTYRQQLELERAQLAPDEQWTYSFVTLSRVPLIQIHDSYYCLSLRSLADLFGEGLYHRMRDACRGDESRVRELGQLFGDVFHEYVYDLWQHIAGRPRVHRLFKRNTNDEIGDGVIMTSDGIVLYDAKSRRPALPVLRSGNLDAFVEDMQKGVISAIRQLNAAVSELRTNAPEALPEGMNLTKIFPVVITATSFPEIGFIYERIDDIATAEGLLQQAGVAPIQVIDVQSLELMEGLHERGVDCISLLTDRVADPQLRNESFQTLLYQRYGALKPSQRMRRVFSLMLDCLLEWLSTGEVNETTLDKAVFPENTDEPSA